MALMTRTWATSLAGALMVLICHGSIPARQYSWLYHIFGWLLPLSLSLTIYFFSPESSSQDPLNIGAEKFGKVQVILSIILLGLCILINSISLLRIARRAYRLRHTSHDNQRTNPRSQEGQRLIDEEEIVLDTAASQGLL